MITLIWMVFSVFKMSSDVSVCLSLENWCLQYCSTVMGIASMCLLFLVMTHAVLVIVFWRIGYCDCSPPCQQWYYVDMVFYLYIELLM